MIEKILNEDGTVYCPPPNPLKEKWAELYPGCDVIGYKCMFCGKCPLGDYWKVPEEDRDVWRAYLQDVRQYHIDHGNTIDAYEILVRTMNEQLKNSLGPEEFKEEE